MTIDPPTPTPPTPPTPNRRERRRRYHYLPRAIKFQIKAAKAWNNFFYKSPKRYLDPEVTQDWTTQDWAEANRKFRNAFKRRHQLETKVR
jgi:hypothetical protein